VGRKVLIVVAAAACTLVAGGCGASAPEGGEFDPRVPEGFVKDKVVADVRANVALDATELEEPVVDCTQQEPTGEEATDEGVFDCEATIEDPDGQTVGRQRWEIGVEIDPQTADNIVRSAERISSTIGEAPQPTG